MAPTFRALPRRAIVADAVTQNALFGAVRLAVGNFLLSGVCVEEMAHMFMELALCVDVHFQLFPCICNVHTRSSLRSSDSAQPFTIAWSTG